MAEALIEIDSLGLWHGACLWPAESATWKKILQMASALSHQTAGAMVRRRVERVVAEKTRGRWWGELEQAVAGKVFRKRLWADQMWERQERGLTREAARMLRHGRFRGYVGLEHGALEALQAAKQFGVRTCLVFTSPHHSFRKKWVEDRMRAEGLSVSLEERELWRRGIERDQRRDEEMQIADLVVTNSSLVSATLAEGGCDPTKLQAEPLGAEAPKVNLPFRKRSGPVRFLASGPVSLRKGSPFLLQAWKKVSPRAARLDFYGGFLLDGGPARWQTVGVTFHGNRPPHEVQEAYHAADVLIFPTLCDGFGMVVAEAMAAGCVVITTRNAGASDWIEDGKNGWVVEPGSAESLAEAIQKAIDTGDCLEEMKERAREKARQNSWYLFRRRFRDALKTGGL